MSEPDYEQEHVEAIINSACIELEEIKKENEARRAKQKS